MANGDMVALSESFGQINTSEQISAFDAFQKLCVVNGSNKYIADFSNSLIEFTTAFTTPPLKGDTLTQATSEAVMLVDTVSLDKKKVYGFRIGEAVFDVTNTITSDNVGADTMDPSPVTPSAVTDRANGPLWYAWTRHPSGTLDLPSEAYLGCLYRGRAVLSGNPKEPFQWYMSRQGDIHDFDYAAGDAQTPVKGGNSNMGIIGDAVVALIPLKDDFLIFGCATSIWYAADDPAYGGTLNALDLTTGMYGAYSWCLGPGGWIYFWGTNGLYRTTIPGVPECISQIRVPDLVKDTGADTSTHRISLAYDRRNNGINIFITKRSDGTNSNWWYDLTTEGFFPEEYPEECAGHSSFYYASAIVDDRNLLVGGSDGYIRKFDRDAKSDDIGGTDEAIDSYVTLAPIPLSKEPDSTGKLSSFNLVSTGGKPSGSQADSNDVYFKIYTDLTAEGIIEQLKADGAPKVGGTFVAPGKRPSNKRPQKIKGSYVGIKLGNSSLNESWAFAQFYGTIKPSGRIK